MRALHHMARGGVGMLVLGCLAACGERVDPELAKANAEAGAAFLERNASRAEVVVLPSGLQYEVLVSGEGEKPRAHDRVRVHYRGTLIDGREFDSSFTRGEPVVFVLDQAIAGWTEGLQLMPVGSTWRLFVPPELAYGERTLGELIGPNSVLVFEVQLLGVLGRSS